MSTVNRKPYPSDVSDDEWALVAPYLTLLPEDAGQRRYELREVFNGLRWIVRAGAPWRLLPNDLPPWEMVYQQTQRWLVAGCLEALAHDTPGPRAAACWSRPGPYSLRRPAHPPPSQPAEPEQFADHPEHRPRGPVPRSYV